MNAVWTILVLVAALHTAHAADIVYSNNFETQQTAGWTTERTSEEWSTPVQISLAPNGTRRFLGEFGNQSATLTLHNLPKHDTLTVSFDLLIIRSWDGNNDPDLWELRADGELLASTTFSNGEFPQAYPGPYPVSRMDSRTGAAKNNSIGFQWNETDAFTRTMDSYYRLQYSFPHTASSVQLEFKALLTDAYPFMANESWGIDNMVVQTGTPNDTTATAPSKTPGDSVDIPQYDLSDVVIAMRRTACFGTCPAYSVRIYGSGKVEFQGDLFVEHTGFFVDSIPQAAVNRLVHALHSKGFFTMQDRYENRRITDLPSTITAFESSTIKKSVFNYYGAPQELEDIEQLIDDTAGTLKWVRGAQ